MGIYGPPADPEAQSFQVLTPVNTQLWGIATAKKDREGDKEVEAAPRHPQPLIFNYTSNHLYGFILFRLPRSSSPSAYLSPDSSQIHPSKLTDP